MKLYTHAELEAFVKSAINESVSGLMEWIVNETDVIEKGTGKVLEDVEIGLKPNAKKPIATYIYPRLKEKGITFYFSDEDFKIEGPKKQK